MSDAATVVPVDLPPGLRGTRQGNVAVLTLARPEKRNALNANTCRQLLDAFSRAEADPAIGAILLLLIVRLVRTGGRF